MSKKGTKFISCYRCGRKIPENRNSIYCSERCRKPTHAIGVSSGKLIEEIYMLIVNKKLFSNEEVGRKLRSDEFMKKFDEVIYIQDLVEKNECEKNE